MLQRKCAREAAVIRLAQALVLECDQTTRWFHHLTKLQPRLLYFIPHHYDAQIKMTLK